MRQLVFLASFALLIAFPAAHALEGCGADMSRIGFKDKDGKDYEVWKCNGGWRLSNLANEQAYINGDDKPCVKNASTGQEFCCPQVSSADKTDTKAKAEASKDSIWKCAGPEGVANPKPEEMKELLITPLNKNGAMGSTVYRISGGNDSKSKEIQAKDKKSRLNIKIEVPQNSTGDKEGSISLESPLGSGGGSDKCETKDQGSFCQLPRDITKHSYESNESSKYIMQDSPSGGNGSKAVQTDTTGKGAYSAR